MDVKQLSYFSESEWMKMISPEFSRQKNRAEWNLRKARFGVIRLDLTKDLEMTGDGYPKIKPFFGYPDFPLIDFNEALRLKDYDY